MIEKVKTFFELIRFFEWRGFLLMALFGFLLTEGFIFPMEKILIFWLIIFLFLAFGFSANECFDYKEDIFNPTKKNPIAQGKISKKDALVFSSILGILGIFLSLHFGLKFFFYCLIWVLIGFFYSAPPLRFKSKPIFDIISHGFFAGVFFFLAPFLVFPVKLNLFYYLLFFSFFYFSILLELRNELEDYFSDKEAGLKTTVYFLGYENSKKILFFLASLFPFIIWPIFLLKLPYLFSSISTLTLIFLILFAIFRNYRILDAFTILSYFLIALDHIF